MSRPIVQGHADAPMVSPDDTSACAWLKDWLGERWQASALFLDVDGTLLDIAESPDSVCVSRELCAALQSLYQRLGGALALVSGRSVDSLDRLFAPLQLPASGVHGAQLRLRAGEPLCRVSTANLSAPIRERLHTLAGAHAGVLVEDKGSSIALHYRCAPVAGEVLASSLHRLLSEPEGQGLRLLPGKMVFEVIAHACDKAQAIRHFLEVEPFAGRHPLFIGDDVTDELALAMMPELGGLALSVGQLLPGARAAFADAAQVRAALIRIAGEIPR